MKLLQGHIWRYFDLILFLMMVALFLPAAVTVYAAPPPESATSGIDPVSHLPINEAAALADDEAELMRCSAYYGIAYQGGLKSGASKDVLEKLAKARGYAFHLGYLLGKRIGMTDDAQLETVKMFDEKIVQKLHGTWVNMSALNPLLLKCKNVLEHPDERMKYWLQYEEKRSARIQD